MTATLTLWDRLRSMRHAASLALSERTGRLRRPAPEVPARVLPSTGSTRIHALSQRYRVRFELEQDAAGALQAYEYLDFLDQALTDWNLAPPQRGVVHDVGCASFAYASALTALLEPTRLVGIELEGYRRLRGGVNRAERAASNVGRLPSASFIVADYARFAERADLVTAFFPFVTAAPVLGWRMPLSVLKPQGLFNRIAMNLDAGGAFWMVNHSEAEAAVAARYAECAGLVPQRRLVARDLLRERATRPVVSSWHPPRA